MHRTTSRRHASPPCVLVALASLAVACNSATPTPPPPTTSLPAPAAATPSPVAPAPTAPPPAATPAGSQAPSPEPSPTPAPPARIPQPPPPAGLAVAPEDARVDLDLPAFSNPTSITNPLFPVSSQASVLMLGIVDGKPFRTEVTLLPFTRIIEWQGTRIETAISQYNAYLDGRINEVAYDYYAQADDGSVWYFGEDVFDFVDGVIVSTEGTWLAGRDATAAMIMPAQPAVGDVYRPENAPGFVFEEVTVRQTGLSLDGPLGPVDGGLLVRELHADGATEDKLFAPGYGEFLTGGGGDLEAIALAVPTDALPGRVPDDLTAMGGGALRAFDLAGSRAWARVAGERAAIRAAWSTVRERPVPEPLAPLMAGALRRLDRAIAARSVPRTRGAAIEIARLADDLGLRHRPQPEVDLARFDLWAAQVLVDAAARDTTGVRADVFALDYTRDRFLHTLDATTAGALNAWLGELQAAVVEDDLASCVEGATALRALLRERLPGG